MQGFPCQLYLENASLIQSPAILSFPFNTRSILKTKTKTMEYSFLKSVVKGIKYPILIVVGLLLSGFKVNYFEIWNLTVGGLLIVLYDMLKHWLGFALI